MVKQIGLLPAGCQPWNTDVVATSGDRFVYCATLAIYIYQLEKKFNEFRLISIMSEHKKTINSVCFHPRTSDLIVSAGCDKCIFVWNITEQCVVAKLENVLREAPKSVSWMWTPKGEEAVCFIQGRGPLNVWPYKSAMGIYAVKEAASFPSNVCQIRWHPKNNSKVALGHMDGSVSVCVIGGKSHKCQFRHEDLEDDEEDPVMALEWDPLSHDYLMICTTTSPTRLVDTNSLTVITEYQLPSAATKVHTLAWISGAPGMFITGDVRSGILRVWNVSRSTPIENIPIKKNGIVALQTIIVPKIREKKKDSPKHKEQTVSSTSATLAPASVNKSHFALPPAKVVCAFLDGGVGLYDLGGRKWDFLRDQGHIETIFDCDFCPYNADHLATASFDGTIKIWDINTLSFVESSSGNEGVIYSLSWAPGDLNCIVASTSKNGMFIWDVDKRKIVQRFHEAHNISISPGKRVQSYTDNILRKLMHGKTTSVFCVAWNQKDSRRIMSVGADHYCIVRRVDKEIVAKYKHPAPVYGCDWSCHNKDMLATGCEDKCVRVYYVATVSDQPLKVFQGHTEKVFHVKWSPVREGIIASGSDDGTIRIWEYTQESCVMVLKGHSGPVRGILWNTEIPYLLMSGSWDYKILLWDVRDGACVETLLDHGADVYGLASHPNRPFTIASTSRDSTVRIWSLNSLVQPLEMNIVAGKPWNEIIGSIESAMVPGNPPLLAGKSSKEQKFDLESSGGNFREKSLIAWSKFFGTPNGTANLWELVLVNKGIADTLLSDNYKNGIVHVKHLTKFKGSEAQELQMVKMSRYGGGIGAPSREDRIREAAKINLSIGNVQRYCELMVELGEWQHAIAIAPGVSMEYWKSLTQRYITYLQTKDSEVLIPFSTTVGDLDTLVSFYTSRGQIQDALLTAQVACEGTFSSPPLSSTSQGLCNGTDVPTKEQRRLLLNTVDALAEWYFRNGSPVLSACCYLAVDDPKKAMWKLIQGHELELAVSIGTVLGNVPEQTYLAFEYLSRRCEHLQKWDLAVDLLKLIPNNEILLIKCCARCSAGKDEIDLLHARAGIPSLERCQHEAETLKNQVQIHNSIKYYMVSPCPEEGLKLGLDEVKKIIQKPGWTVHGVFPLLNLLASMRSDKLQQHKLAQSCGELQCFCAYVGGLMAIHSGYDEIVKPLFMHARYIMSRESLNLPITDVKVNQEMEAWTAIQQKKAECYPDDLDLGSVTLSPEVMTVYRELCRKADVDGSNTLLGANCVASSHLPSHSDVHISCITHKRISGLAYFLEDGKSAVSPNEALMWAKVNPFSPLSSGLRINPF